MRGHHTGGSGDKVSPLEDMSSDSALEILNRRYALWEIDRKEYEIKKAVIGNQ